MKSLLPLTLALFSLACSSNDGGTPAAGTDAGTDTATAPDNLIKFTMNVKVAPGTEVHRCQFIQMPKSADGGEIFIGGRSHKYTPGSHHFLIFRTDLTSIPAELAKQVGCFEGDGVMKHQRGYVHGGQKTEGKDEFPAGVGMAFKSGEVLLFQAHYINPGKTELDATVNVDWKPVDKATIQHRAGVTNFYNPFIVVPPKSDARANMSCPFTGDITILGAGPHMHKRGVHYEAFMDEVGKPPADKPFYTTDDWEHPVDFIGPVVVKAGTRVRFSCHYKNTDDRTYLQGQSAELDEMCMFSAVYYPEMKLEDNQCRGGMAQIGQGTLKCTDVGACMQACPPEERADTTVFPPKLSECVQKCAVDSCPSAIEKFLPQLSCLQANCAAECKAGDAECRTCMGNKCLAVSAACLSHTCE